VGLKETIVTPSSEGYTKALLHMYRRMLLLLIGKSQKTTLALTRYNSKTLARIIRI
jgi:hypothetical protein